MLTDEMATPIAIGAPAWTVGEKFLQGILLEIGYYPKPGLVCFSSNGAHRDMNGLTFMASSAAIAPAFYRCAQVGWEHEGELTDLLPIIRKIGRFYEEKMMAATKGVNTQRGILFAAGVLCAAAGFVSKTETNPPSERVLAAAAGMTKGLVTRELGCLKPDKPNMTAGEQLYLRYGVTGIRGEVEAGFPAVTDNGLPALRDSFSRAENLTECLVHALLSLMTRTEDTTILWRKGLNQLREVQNRAQDILDKGSIFTPVGRDAVRRLDEEFCAAGISPGGSADLLAATIGLYLLENGQFPVRLL
jgi:triphosphoribosyl-dephospho-CoA synthase